jgi:hypothetical protein
MAVIPRVTPPASFLLTLGSVPIAYAAQPSFRVLTGMPNGTGGGDRGSRLR